MKFHSNPTVDRKPTYEKVVLAVANERGVDPTDLEPLYATVDPEALDDLFNPGVDGQVEFTYMGHEVTVCSDETVQLDGAPVSVGTSAVSGPQDETSEVGASK